MQYVVETSRSISMWQLRDKRLTKPFRHIIYVEQYLSYARQKPKKFSLICSSKKLILFRYMLSLTVLDLHFKNMTDLSGIGSDPFYHILVPTEHNEQMVSLRKCRFSTVLVSAWWVSYNMTGWHLWCCTFWNENLPTDCPIGSLPEADACPETSLFPLYKKYSKIQYEASPLSLTKIHQLLAQKCTLIAELVAITVRLLEPGHLEEHYPITFFKNKRFSYVFANGLITFMNLRAFSWEVRYIQTILKFSTVA